MFFRRTRKRRFYFLARAQLSGSESERASERGEAHSLAVCAALRGLGRKQQNGEGRTELSLSLYFVATLACFLSLSLSPSISAVKVVRKRRERLLWLLDPQSVTLHGTRERERRKINSVLGRSKALTFQEVRSECGEREILTLLPAF